MKRKANRSILSFSKEEISNITLDFSGVSLATPEGFSTEEYLKTFDFASALPKSNPTNGNERFMPKPEDYVNVPFRLISATIVAGGSWRATDFSDEKILKKSVNKLADKPIYKDHAVYTVDNAIGILRNPKWTNSFTDSKGNKIPAGIDGVVCIDGVSEPKMARRVVAGDVASNSVTVEFEWIPSHKFDTPEEFDRKCGTKGPDGKMIVRKVTKVVDYYESSMVFLGADPYAKRLLDNGDLKDVHYSEVYSNSQDVADQEVYHADNKFSVRYGFTGGILSLAYNNPYNKNNDQNNNTMKEIIDALRLKLGLAADQELKATDLDKLSLAGTDVDFTSAVADFFKQHVDEAVDTATFGKESVLQYAQNPVFPKSQSELVALRGEKSVLEGTIVTLTSEKDALANDKTVLEGTVATLTSEKQALETDKTTLTGEVTTLKDTATANAPLVAVGQKFIADKRAETLRLYNLTVDNKPVASMVELIANSDASALDGLLASYSQTVKSKFGARCRSCKSTEIELQSSLSEDFSHGGSDDLDKGVDDVSFTAIADRVRKNQGNSGLNLV